MTHNIRTIILLPFMIMVISGCSGNKDKSSTSAIPVDGKMSHGSTVNEISIHEAALNGQLNLVIELTAKIKSIDTTDTEGRTALMYAAYNGYYDIVKFLVDRGASVNLQDNSGRTALMMASSGPFPVVVKFLLEHQANPNLVDKEEHYTALMYASAEGQTEVVKTLLAYGADPFLKDVDGDDALSFAKKNGHHDVAKILASLKK